MSAQVAEVAQVAQVARSTRFGALITLLAGALSLGLAGLLAPAVCLLALMMILFAGVLVPRWISWLTSGSRQRSGAAVLALLLLVIATAASGPGALNTGGVEGALGTAAGQLALPSGVPIGLLAALAAGALVAVPLELADRRGVQSALVLGIAVTGLASVAAPGRHLLPALALGWPAVLFTVAQLAGAGGPPGSGSTPTTEVIMRRTPGVGAATIRGLLRWNLLPVLAAITLSCAAVAVAVLTGVAGTTHAGGGWSALTGGSHFASSRVTSDYLSGSMDLDARGALGKQPLFQVPTDSPRLWRAGTLDTYTGRSWLATAAPNGLQRFTVDGPNHLSLIESPSALPSGAGAGTGTTATAVSRTDQVRLLVSSTQVLAPGRLTGYGSPNLAGGSVFTSAGDRFNVVPVGVGQSDYQVRSVVLPDADDPASRDLLLTGVPSTQVDAEAADPRWTELPADLPDRVRQLGTQLVTTAPSRLAAVQAVEAELDRRMTYTLNSPVPKADADAVDDVLFTSHRGFCEQFASAEVVLLRSAGVPARLAVGFSGGEPGDDGLRTVNRSEAHAWVEVWFPGVGWASSDPTPAAATSPSWSQSIRDGLRRLVDEPVTWVATGLLTLLLLGLLLGAGYRWWRTDSGPESSAGRLVDPDLAAAFFRLEAELAAEGVARAPSETVAELARRLPDESVRQALVSFERALYAADPPDRQECLAAATAIHRWLDRDAVVQHSR